MTPPTRFDDEMAQTEGTSFRSPLSLRAAKRRGNPFSFRSLRERAMRSIAGLRIATAFGPGMNTGDCAKRERHTGRSLQNNKLMSRKRIQLVIDASFHEICDLVCCFFLVHRMPMVAHGVGFVTHTNNS